jgi:hypothetical protein
VEAVFGRRSVVRIARETSSNRAGERPSTSRGRALVIFAGSSSTPITPVEATSTSVAGIRRWRAACLAVSSATASPVRVAQLALPALIRMALAAPWLRSSDRRDSRTGAAWTRFWVNTPAADAAMPVTISARSSFSTLRMPA